jgi:hypothetical protein
MATHTMLFLVKKPSFLREVSQLLITDHACTFVAVLNWQDYGGLF